MFIDIVIFFKIEIDREDFLLPSCTCKNVCIY